MTDPNTTEPTRLLDDPSLGEVLRRDLEVASTHAPIAYDATAGLARFERALAAPSSTAAPATASVATGGRVLGWILGASVLIAGVGTASWVMKQAKVDHRVVSSSSPADAPREFERVRTEDATVVGQAAPSGASEAPEVGARASEAVAKELLHPEVEDAVPTPSPEIGEVAEVEGGDPVAASSAPPRPSSKPAVTPSSQGSEAEQINAARKALRDDPARALALIEATEKAFPKGAMIQEREGYAILALLALDRHDEAESRASAYLARWPKGPLSRRVRDALAR